MQLAISKVSHPLQLQLSQVKQMLELSNKLLTRCLSARIQDPARIRQASKVGLDGDQDHRDQRIAQGAGPTEGASDLAET